MCAGHHVTLLCTLGSCVERTSLAQLSGNLIDTQSLHFTSTTGYLQVIARVCDARVLA